MTTKLEPHISFRDNTRQAMEFYKSVFGGQLVLNTFKEYNVSKDPSEDNKIMHAYLKADNGLSFMAADTPNGMDYRPGSNFGMSLSGENAAELTNYFNKLSSGGTVVMPLEKSPWGDTFGMVTDKFGVSWMVDIVAPH